MRIITNKSWGYADRVKAPIDEKNVCSDTLLDAVFDDGIYTENENEALGFVTGIPTCTHYSGNRFFVDRLFPSDEPMVIKTQWHREIIYRLTGIERDILESIDGGLRDYFTAKDDGTSLLCSFFVEDYRVLVVFRYDCPLNLAGGDLQKH